MPAFLASSATPPRIYSRRNMSPGPHPSRSAPVVESSLPPIESDLESPIHPYGPRSNHRTRTVDPSHDLSRISSLDGHDTETELGPMLTRVTTAPMSSSSPSHLKPGRSANKLARMGFSPNEAANRPQPPSSTKRFGFKSLIQSLKSKP
jgi:hypothetical protein